MSISYEGIGQVLATFRVEEGTGQGAVTLVDNGTVGYGRAGDLPCGVLVCGEKNGMGAVQVEGFVTLSYTGSAPSLGYAILTCDGKGGVMEEEVGKEFLVVSVDEDAETAVIKL